MGDDQDTDGLPDGCLDLAARERSAEAWWAGAHERGRALLAMPSSGEVEDPERMRTRPRTRERRS